MTAFQPGDIVTVGSDLELHAIYRMEGGKEDSFVQGMDKWAGKQVTIKEIVGGKYTIREARWYWVDEMFVEFFHPVEKWQLEELPDLALLF